MTSSEFAILTVLDAAPNKTASWRDLRDASGVKTTAGFRRVIFKMVERQWIARADKHGLDMTITFGGMRAWRADASGAAHRARQMNAELPEATRDVLKLKGMI